MTISNINLAMGASSYGAYNQRLTSATKAELEKYGIPYNPDITEREGKSLLKQFKTQKAHNENSSGANLNNQHKNQTNDLLERARKLANQMGVGYDETTPLRTLLALIEQALVQKAQASNNNAMLDELKVFSEELSAIKAQSEGMTYNATSQALEKSLEMLSLYNKNFLNH